MKLLTKIILVVVFVACVQLPVLARGGGGGSGDPITPPPPPPDWPELSE